jgi:hypothetical protein
LEVPEQAAVGVEHPGFPSETVHFNPRALQSKLASFP